ncbi:MAG: hypothetical protein V2A34_00460 [Lentisphaerota bacterium]
MKNVRLLGCLVCVQLAGLIGEVLAQEIRFNTTNVFFGRQMLDSIVVDSSVFAINFASGDRSFGLTPESGLIVWPDSSTTLPQFGIQNVRFTLTNTAAGSGTVGVKNWSVAATGNVDIGFGHINSSATIVSNRMLSANNGASVNLGRVLMNTDTLSSNVTIRTSGDDLANTRLTIGSGAFTYNGADWLATVQSGSGAVFSDGSSTLTRSLYGRFFSAGNQNVTAIYTPGGEGLAGESIQNLRVDLAAQVYRPAQLDANNVGIKSPGQFLSISNASVLPGELRAHANIAGLTIRGGAAWTVDGLGVGSNILPGVDLRGTVGFNTQDKLNGIHQADVTFRLQNDQTINGTSSNDLGDISFTLQTSLAGGTGTNGSADVQNGQALAGFGLGHTNGVNEFHLAGGFAPSNLTLQISYDDYEAGLYSPSVQVDGLGSSLTVLVLKYDPTVIPPSMESSLLLGKWNGSGWINAVMDNAGGTPTRVERAYQSGDAVGVFGVDTLNNEVWAVMDRPNGQYAVIPEPLTMGLWLAGFSLLSFARRRSR